MNPPVGLIKKLCRGGPARPPADSAHTWIREFRLRLIKERPDWFVSVCFPGKPEKISPTVYEFIQKAYVPQDKLVVYFYSWTRK
jgi:hypothetical protein